MPSGWANRSLLDPATAAHRVHSFARGVEGLGSLVLTRTFATEFDRLARRTGPLCVGIDPSSSLLNVWDLPDDAEGARTFGLRVVDAASETVAVVKPQAAYFERFGWSGFRAMQDVCSAAQAAGLLVILDAKRGDIGDTSGAYAQGYLGPAPAAFPIDALTAVPYLGVTALRPMFDAARASGRVVFVVVRSSNAEGFLIQTATSESGRSVEGEVMVELARFNASDSEEVGAAGAVFAANTARPPPAPLDEMKGLFLVPGLGHQGGTVDQVAQVFADCPRRVIPSVSRGVLVRGPDVKALRAAIARQAGELRAALSW